MQKVGGRQGNLLIAIYLWVACFETCVDYLIDDFLAFLLLSVAVHLCWSLGKGKGKEKNENQGQVSLLKETMLF